jgi:hypothetical protein
MILGARNLVTKWQVGDGREEALAQQVEAHARQRDVDDVIRVIDDFCYHESIMMNVGDEKGEILDRAVQRTRPRRLLELGTYCGYSALRMVRVMPEEGRLYSIEFSAANAEIARRIWEHAGIGDRVTVLVGMRHRVFSALTFGGNLRCYCLKTAAPCESTESEGRDYICLFPRLFSLLGKARRARKGFTELSADSGGAERGWYRNGCGQLPTAPVRKEKSDDRRVRRQCLRDAHAAACGARSGGIGLAFGLWLTPARRSDI